MDAAAFPSVARYLADLPAGLSSHPNATAKASLSRTMLTRSPLVGIRPGELPPPVFALIQDPPPVSSWIPEVHSHALLAAVYDRNFRSQRAFAAYCYQSQRDLFEGPLYRLMFLVVSPILLLRGAERRWRAFHRGSKLRVEHAGSKSVTITLSHPIGLWDEIGRVGLMEGLRAAVDAAGAHRSRVAVVSADERRTVFEGGWT